MNKVNILSEKNPDILSQIKANVGRYIRFSNGCTLDLINDDGIYQGTGPYGIDWACNVDEEVFDSILQWVEYWNADRTENGTPMAD